MKNNRYIEKRVPLKEETMFKAYQNYINQTRITFLELYQVESVEEFKE